MMLGESRVPGGVTRRRERCQEGGTLAPGDAKGPNMEEKRPSERRTLGRGPPQGGDRGEAGQQMEVRSQERSVGWGSTGSERGVAP